MDKKSLMGLALIALVLILMPFYFKLTAPKKDNQQVQKQETVDTTAAPVDSAALALVLAWMRAAQSRGREVRIEGIPEQLRSLAALYGIGDFLPIEDAPA